MNVVESFIDRWQRLETSVAGPLSLATRTAMAAAEALPGTQAAVICLHDPAGGRLVIGASDPQSLLAEQWEYTIGDGPGLHAQRNGSAVVAGTHFRRRWPVFHEALLSHTAFRSVRAVPLAGVTPELSATMLLYSDAAGGAYRADTADILEVAQIIACTVACTMTELSTQLHQPVTDGTAVHLARRLNIGVAIGMVTAAHRLSNRDAFDVLRGYAYAHDHTVDHAAHRLTTGQIDTDTI